MFLKLLEKFGKKKTVLDRGPSHPRYNEAKPWMNRYYVLFRYRPKWFPFNILIHEMLADDHGEGVHNHLDRKSVVQGKSVDLGGRRIIKKFRYDNR